MFELINTRRIGRMYHRFCQYIAAIRCGEKAILFGEGYVVMSMDQYHDMLPKREIKIVGCSSNNELSGYMEFIDDLQNDLNKAVGIPQVTEPLRFEIPDKYYFPRDRKTPAQKCNYSTKFR